MEILVNKGDVLETNADLLVIGAYEESDWDNAFMVRVDEALGGKFKKFAKSQDFKGAAGQSMLFPAPDALSNEYVLIVGLGKEGENLITAAREAAGLAVQTVKRLGLKTLAMELFGEDDEKNFNAKEYGQAVAEALLMADYQFVTYKKQSKPSNLKQVEIITENGRDANNARKGVERATHIAQGISLARDLVNTPAIDMTPTKLAEAAEEIARTSKGVRVKIYDQEWCEKKNMNSYLAVSRGSEEPPKFIHLVYKPAKAKKKIALVGKGVTFDSGGLSLKPSAYMETMKCDMGGAAAVLGAFRALAALQPKAEVHGIIAATENLPSGRAIKPGDVVTASNGKTIEILNTDAEGRLTLADALHFAGKQKVDYIIDLATLTGACVVGLGEEIAALMGNDAKFSNDVLDAAAAAGEKMWEMPLEKRYRKLLDSQIADVRNIATSSYGGSLTAGLFLQEFVPENTKWAHLDIAGPAYAERPLSSYLGKGGSGFGVRTLLNAVDAL